MENKNKNTKGEMKDDEFHFAEPLEKMLRDKSFWEEFFEKYPEEKDRHERFMNRE